MVPSLARAAGLCRRWWRGHPARALPVCRVRSGAGDDTLCPAMPSESPHRLTGLTSPAGGDPADGSPVVTRAVDDRSTLASPAATARMARLIEGFNRLRQPDEI